MGVLAGFEPCWPDLTLAVAGFALCASHHSPDTGVRVGSPDQIKGAAAMSIRIIITAALATVLLSQVAVAGNGVVLQSGNVNFR
jgi:hypothetical protein